MDRALDYYMPHVNQEVVRDFESWWDHPQLGKLINRLDSMGDPQEFMVTYAKAVVARHLFRQGLDLKVDVPVPHTKPANLEATRGGTTFVVHVKCLNPDRATKTQLDALTRAKSLEEIKRPLIALLDFDHDLAERQVQEVVTQSRTFLSQAQVGEAIAVKDEDGADLGTCQVWREWKGPHVAVMTTPSLRWGRDWRRFRTLFTRCYRRFVPGVVNLILVTGAWPDDATPVERALLGTPQTRREGRGRSARFVELGRKPDGFWSPGQYPDSKVAGWFFFVPKDSWFRCHLWFRPDADLDPALQAELTRIFDAE